MLTAQPAAVGLAVIGAAVAALGAGGAPGYAGTRGTGAVEIGAGGSPGYAGTRGTGAVEIGAGGSPGYAGTRGAGPVDRAGSGALAQAASATISGTTKALLDIALPPSDRGSPRRLIPMRNVGICGAAVIFDLLRGDAHDRMRAPVGSKNGRRLGSAG
jgi:hypothetical protein